MEQKLYNALCKFMEFQTKDCVWYYDTPEQRFERSSESIWLMNPKTKKWVLELRKSRDLCWSYVFYVGFKRYFNMERSDYEKFIKIWVEDVLNWWVSTTGTTYEPMMSKVEDVLNRGVSSMFYYPLENALHTEVLMLDVLNRGVSTTGSCLRPGLWKKPSTEEK